MDIPKGFRKVYNRSTSQYERTFDGAPQVFEPGEERLLPQELAEFLSEASIFKYDILMGTVQRMLVLDGDEEFGKPYTGDKPIELIDRSIEDNPLGRFADTKTHVEVRQVPGAVGEIRREMSMKPRPRG